MSYFIHRFDPFIEMGPDEWTDVTYAYGTTFEDFVNGEIEHVETLAYDPRTTEVGDVPAIVTVNTDNATDPSVWFIHWHMLDGTAADQTDYIFLIRDDDESELGDNGEPLSDISMIGGAQCGDCGRVNTDAKYNRKHNLIAPVWRQHPDTANMLCNDCADKRWAK